MGKKIVAADLFCGAGGTSSGLVEACSDLGFKAWLTAINHNETALKTHSANHPSARHLCASIDNINPRELYPQGHLDILWASPECTHHSLARGGKPINDQSRATAWCVARWADALRPDVILVENVKEFTTWGPIKNGQKDKQKLGATFLSWVEALRSFGYRVEWRTLCAADYGDPTTRRRLFVQAVKGRRRIVWPEPTHAPKEKLKDGDLFWKKLRPWVTARDIIDWSIPGRSVYFRKKPIAPKTMRRILIGFELHGGLPFVLGQQSGSQARNINEPAPTVATSGAIMLVQPFLVNMKGQSVARSIDESAPTVTAHAPHLYLAEPYLIKLRGTNNAASIDQPAPTVTAGGCHLGIVQPYIITIDHRSGNGALSSVDEPISTITTKQRHAIVQPYLIKFNGTATACSIDQPVGALTTKDRYGLVEPIIFKMEENTYMLDFLLRMLTPRELARVQGFPDTYQFAGSTKDVVKQIGNAVPRNLAKALVRAVLSQQP